MVYLIIAMNSFVEYVVEWQWLVMQLSLTWIPGILKSGVIYYEGCTLHI